MRRRTPGSGRFLGDELPRSANGLLDRLNVRLAAVLLGVEGDHLGLVIRIKQRSRGALSKIGVDREVVVAGRLPVEVEVALEPLGAGEPEVGVDREVVVAG